MKKYLLLYHMVSLILVSGLAIAQLPPEIPGENFQRVKDENFQDCQNYRIPAIKSEETKKVIQREINKTTCFYKVFFMLREGGGKRDMIMYVETDNITGQTKTGYMNVEDPNLTL